VQWRRGEEAGVVFTRGRQAPDWALALDRWLADRMENLEREIASLRGMLKRLQDEIALGSDESRLTAR